MNINDINLNFLRFFIVTAESDSLEDAGEKLGYSYSTVSTNITKLEEQLGIKLFTRKPLKLTDIGKEVYETVKRGFMDIDFAMTIANSKNNIENGKLSIGCPSHILQFYLMDKIAKAVKDYPNLQIDLDTAYECEDLIEALKKNKIDFAILDRVPIEYENDIDVKEIQKSKNIFVSNKKIIIKSMKEFNKYKYILAGEQRPNMIKLSKILKNYDIELKAVLRCGMTEQRVNAAKGGIGIAYVLKESVKKELEKGELFEVEIPDKIELPQTSLNLVYLKEHLTKVDKEFIKKYMI